MQRQLLPAQVTHELGLLLDDDDLAVIDHSDPICKLLRLFDVVGRQDDGDALFAQRLDHIPHILAQFDVDAGRGLVEKQNIGLVDERLGNQDPSLHAAG